MKELPPGRRLDQVLVDQGYVASRSRARDLILRGFVVLNGEIERRPSRKVLRSASLKVTSEALQFVSRGAEKLAAALDYFAYEPNGIACLDVGASTGGFTQVLLDRGARQVTAVDVGSDQLHQSVRDNPRVRSYEQTDARHLTEEVVGGPVGCLVVDVSFISLIKVLPFVIDYVVPNGFAVLLVKPQFEVGSEHIGKGGVVRDEAVRIQSVRDVQTWLVSQGGWIVDGVIESPIVGGSGNIEYLLGARKGA